ncbi:MAG: alpha/beta fold hydrolase [Candidatus Omnitrophica bacterium]|nr:alpha/beta fold hydrolase [Candidatus Omnitrophota bacterium]MCB9720621.1 alpha/beta fold hydrolase [Candidatus Omnitrophota bacterium]
MTEKVVVTTSDNKKISLDHYRQGHQQVVVLAHGFYNSKQAVLFREMATGLLEEYDVIVFDFRGHGKSSGLFSWTVNEHRDLQAVLDYADQEYDKIGVIGFSLGAAIAINTAARDSRIDSLIAVSSPYDFNRINYRVWQMGVMENVVYNVFQEGRIGKGIRPGWLFRKKPKPIDAVGQVNAPTLFVHGQKDWLIAPEHSRKLYRKANCRKDLMILKEGTHAEYIFRADKDGTLAVFREWFHKTLGS